MPESSRSAPTPAQSLREYGRGIAGGLLFSLPVVYTMEMWWTGFTATPERLLTGLGATLALLLLYNRYSGLRASASWREVAIDSFEELGIGLLLSLGLLWLTGRVGAGVSFDETMGKVILEGMAAAIGVSVGTAQLGAAETQHDEASQGMHGDGENGDATEHEDAAHGEDKSQGMHGDDGDDPSFFSTVALGLCGAFLVASSVAPTDEIVHIASETSFGHLVGIALLSFLMGGLILYFSHFRGAASTDAPGVRDAVVGVFTTYAVALVTSAFLLWFFNRFGGADLLHTCALTVVLGLPAALGASAGRLLLGSDSD